MNDTRPYLWAHVLQGEDTGAGAVKVVCAPAYDALAAELAAERRDHDNCRHNRQENLRNLTRVEESIRELEAALYCLEHRGRQHYCRYCETTIECSPASGGTEP